MTVPKKLRQPHRVAARLAGAYVLIAALWIAGSDRLVSILASSESQALMLQTAKGWGFVLLTGLALYWLVRRQLAAADRSRGQLQLLANQSLAGTYVTMNGRIIRTNDRLLTMLGREREEVIGRPLADFIHPDDLARFAKLAGPPAAGKSTRRRKRSSAAGASSPDGRRFQIRLVRTTGEVMFADVVAGEIRTDGRMATLGLVLDDTEKVNLEQQFRRAQRMETLGQLTGAIAHDFNNLLTAIMGALDLSLGNLPEGHEARVEVFNARATADRAAGLSRQLLTFSRKRVVHPRVFDLDDAVVRLRPLVDGLARNSITTDFRAHGALLPIVMDPTQLDQVIVNLVINATEAMCGGGHLLIRTSLAEPDSLRARDGEVPRAHAVVEVTDTGPGIPEEVRLKIFEPFFTTKKKGTGLGLATVYGIVDQADGFIRVHSEVGAGTTFLVFLPLTDRPLTEMNPAAPAAAASNPSGTSESIVVVEDDAAVRGVIKKGLEAVGYRVVAVPDAGSALDIWEAQREDVHLLLTDLMLPGMSGLELTRILRARNPDLSVLFTSGYSRDESMGKDQSLNEIAGERTLDYLEKPFSIPELVTAVRHVLDRRSGTPTVTS